MATICALASHSRANVSSTRASSAGNVAASRLARSACINHLSSSLFIGIANRAPLSSLKLPIRERITILVFWRNEGFIDSILSRFVCRPPIRCDSQCRPLRDRVRLMTHPDAPPLDIEHLRQWIGRSETQTDIVTPRIVDSLRATLEESGDDAPLPSLHWCLAPVLLAMSALGEDMAMRRVVVFCRRSPCRAGCGRQANWFCTVRSRPAIRCDGPRMSPMLLSSMVARASCASSPSIIGSRWRHCRCASDRAASDRASGSL